MRYRGAILFLFAVMTMTLAACVNNDESSLASGGVVKLEPIVYAKIYISGETDMANYLGETDDAGRYTFDKAKVAAIPEEDYPVTLVTKGGVRASKLAAWQLAPTKADKAALEYKGTLKAVMEKGDFQVHFTLMSSMVAELVATGKSVTDAEIRVTQMVKNELGRADFDPFVDPDAVDDFAFETVTMTLATLLGVDVNSINNAATSALPDFSQPLDTLINAAWGEHDSTVTGLSSALEKNEVRKRIITAIAGEYGIDTLDAEKVEAFAVENKEQFESQLDKVTSKPIGVCITPTVAPLLENLAFNAATTTITYATPEAESATDPIDIAFTVSVEDNGIRPVEANARMFTVIRPSVGGIYTSSDASDEITYTDMYPTGTVFHYIVARSEAIAATDGITFMVEAGYDKTINKKCTILVVDSEAEELRATTIAIVQTASAEPVYRYETESDAVQLPVEAIFIVNRPLQDDEVFPVPDFRMELPKNVTFTPMGAESALDLLIPLNGTIVDTNSPMIKKCVLSLPAGTFSFSEQGVASTDVIVGLYDAFEDGADADQIKNEVQSTCKLVLLPLGQEKTTIKAIALVPDEILNAVPVPDDRSSAIVAAGSTLRFAVTTWATEANEPLAFTGEMPPSVTLWTSSPRVVLDVLDGLTLTAVSEDEAELTVTSPMMISLSGIEFSSTTPAVNLMVTVDGDETVKQTGVLPVVVPVQLVDTATPIPVGSTYP